ncbi:Gfo/Idh/MocA family protein [Paenibacillus montanisoli]|uniref:Gfo/Idh/MocA family oxidoreductase n=1 Tax=Paenibacillus montanisoli TaxID=2081970 RepID=A0A328U1J6_9BACL|nr:Gfo/Idh/MocA family oxidoreductase [Paenibacillus montanisoli]RAP76510.1 gfo/Idh/MocA family oxidoreductase [Paenibacillus montanisoli]
MIRVAMLSYWHVHAWDYTKQAQENPNTEIVAVWDELPNRGQENADKLGVPFVADLDELLARTDIDAVVIDTPTNIHRDVMVKAARAGKHIFTEKVVAPTLSEVNEIVAAVNEAGVKLTVSLPRLNDSYTLAIQDVINKGLLGQLTQARVRLSHNGATAGWLPEHFYNLEQCGGGALIDLGCHPVYLNRLFLGQPESVNATFGYVTGKAVDDNTVTVLRYENGAIGIAETGFVNPCSPFCVEIHGTEGSLLFGFTDNVMRVRSTKFENVHEWTEIELPANRISAFDQWVGHIQNDTIAEENIALATDLTKIMEASTISENEKRSVKLSELKN